MMHELWTKTTRDGTTALTDVGVVAIGRNEGERLKRCLKSILGRASAIVYVDSGSTDGSVEHAQELGVQTINLDTSEGFSAGRARNAGLQHLRELRSEARYVQFVDGDCEIDEHWLEEARDWLERNPDYAVVCGRRREIEPNASIYNRLSDLEWDTPIGDCKSCGGDALIRIAAFDQVGGYDPAVIAGEEPEMCFRMRQLGWRIHRLGTEMTRHDAAMTQFGQWWQRAKRAGHAYAQAATLHGLSSERFGVRASASIWTWAVLLPVITMVAVAVFGLIGLIPLAAYPLLTLKIAWGRQRRGLAWRDAMLYAVACVLAKFAQCQGQCRWAWRWLRGQPSKLIEYKQLGAPSRADADS